MARNLFVIAVLLSLVALLTPSAPPTVTRGGHLLLRVNRSSYVARLPVTQGQFAAFVRATGRTVRWSASGPESLPVHGVDWDDAQAYCRWVGLRLPTREEWQAAAAGLPIPAKQQWRDCAQARRAWDLQFYRPTPHRTGLSGLLDRALEPAGYLPVGSHPEEESASGCLDLVGATRDWTMSTDLTGRLLVKGGYQHPDDGTVFRRGETDEDLGFRCAWSEKAPPPTDFTRYVPGL